MTFVSTNHAILYNNAKPVFADVEPDTLNIDPDDIARKMNPRVAAIVVVHYGGHAADMDRIREIADHYGVPVLEDAAHACGALYKGRRIGSLAEVTAFSFHAVKNLAAGDGGMVTVSESGHDKRLRQLRWLGINKDTWTRSDTGENYSWAYNVEELGFKYHMNDITAAIGLVQLAKLDQTNARRREVASLYSEAFGDLGWMEIPVEKSYATSSWHNYVVKVADRDRFMKFLNVRGISTGMHYIPNHLYEIYSPYRTSLPIADAVWTRLVTLPLYPDMSESEVGLIIDAVTAYEA
jgi:perosamine synthetase